jgi:voltage-gated potassium channel
MERRNLIFEEHVRNALLDGFLDSSEKADLEILRKKFGMSKRRAESLVEQVRSFQNKSK